MKAFYAAGLAALLILGGCGSEGDVAVGKWKFARVNAPQNGPTNPDKVNAGLSMLALQIKSDSTYTLALNGKNVSTGTWTIKDHDVTMSPDPPPNAGPNDPPPPSQHATISADGKTLELAKPGTTGGIDFTKSPT